MRRQVMRRTAAAALAFTSAGALVAGAAPAAGAGDPPGNNGTVKVDEVPFDDHPDNEPHVGCTFQVDFYGYDAGDLQATVLFEAVEPTPGGDLLDDELDIGEDAAGGGTDLDASGTYDLTEALAGITPHPEQGWHVRLTVHAEGSVGADTKFKEFWVSGCETVETTTTTTTVPGETTPPGETTTTVPGTTPPTPTEPGAPTTPTEPGSEPHVPPGAGPTVTTTPGAPTTAPSTTSTIADVEGSLPRTGSSAGPLVLAGLAFLTVGAAVLAAARLRANASG